MTQIKTFAEAHAALRQFYGKHADGPYTLDRMRRLMDYLGSPQDKLRVIHIAGTSGKTSTAYFIASILQESGAKVGLTVSPHVDEVNERIQINLVPLPEKEFCQELSEFLTLVGASDILPSYFECMVAFAYWEFAKQEVDYAVVEVGLGGLLDGTNVATRADKVCVITDIGFDHTELLGDTLGKIAAQKAGIVQPGNPVFTYEQDPEVMQAIQEAIRTNSGSVLQVVPQLSTRKVEGLPLFQERNFCLAKAVTDWVFTRDDRPNLSDTQILHAATVYIPARMEIIKHGDKTIIIDGAHNAQKLQTLLDSVRVQYPGRPIAALVGFIEGDNLRLKQSLDILMTHIQTLIATTFYTEKDYPKHSVPSNVIVNYCKQLNWLHADAIDDPKAALEKLLACPEPVVLVTGSFYLLNHIRPLLGIA